MFGAWIFTGSGTCRTLIPRWPRQQKDTTPSGAQKPQAGSSRARCGSSATITIPPAFRLIAHSWGTIVTGLFAGRCPALIDRVVFFGPIARRTRGGAPQRLSAWRLISLRDQWDRFVADVPAAEAPVLSKRLFDEWGERYLDIDPESRGRSPASVKTPSGAFQDIFDAWNGELAYDPGLIRAPIAIIRGEWDSYCTDEDARWLFEAMRASPIRRDTKISRATHLMHLEENRYALYREATTFLDGADQAP
jgi:pimeloyl-ACP methyl ester carboxylesterase